ncbi:MAG TPA: hypothetical protein VHG52_02650 [Thermomicrobiales bacterium]|nr:hypothetical protein [Thermomicrobiales bacterium]
MPATSWYDARQRTLEQGRNGIGQRPWAAAGPVDYCLAAVPWSRQGRLAHGNLLLAAGLPDREDFTVGGFAATHVPRILQMPLRSPAVGDVLVAGALALIESLES